MKKIKTVKIKNEDGSIGEESYFLSTDANIVNMENGYSVEDTIGDINIAQTGNISEQLNNKINTNDIVDNLNNEASNKPLSAKQGYELNLNKADKNLLYDKKEYYKKYIKVFQNENEQKYITYGNYINFGEPSEPPLLDTILNKGFDIIAHFYNDFGLKSTAMSPTQANGNWKWYDWRWNFKDKDSYDSSRVPLLGYYQGDNRRTLDWILYWLGQSGVNVLSIVNPNGITMENWENENSTNHWLYVLINQCKNISSFKILPWILGAHNKTQNDYNNSIDNFLNFVSSYPCHTHTYNYNNKKYLCCFTWDLEGIRGAFDNYSGKTNTINFLKNFTSEIQQLGYDGLCLLCRNPGTTIPMGIDYINDGLLLYKAYYSNIDDTLSTYEEYTNQEITDTTNTVLNIMTAMKSSPEHTSTWNIPGTTPELFQKVLNRNIQHMIKYNLPKMITIYNVSEWAEGGPGLIPNIKDGFGYLHAIAGCQTVLNDNIVVNDIILNTRENILSKTHDFITDKIQITSISANSSRIVEFTNLIGYFNYTYSKTDYIFLVGIETASELKGVTVTCDPNFGTGRIYCRINNATNTAYNDLTNTYVNLIIIKRNSFALS